jgi:hypothetical protein
LRHLASVLFLSAVLILGCQKPSAPDSSTGSTSFRKPTATEVFNLRSKCAELGEKILKNNLIGIALTQDELSHYDPITNRCYVELTVQNADMSKSDYFNQYLFDGQTGEMLATIQNDKRGKGGYVYDNQHHFPLPVPYDANAVYLGALAYIDEKMADDRKK